MRRTCPLLLASLLVPAAAMAQVRSETGGIRLNTHLLGSAISVEDADRSETGIGLGFSIGYGFTPRFLLLVRLDAAPIEPGDAPAYALGHAELALRYNFADSGGRLVPFVSAGPALRVMVWEDFMQQGDLALSGSAVSIGGGLSYFFTPSVALESEVSVGLGRFTDGTLGDRALTVEAFSATTTRFAAGVSWYPRGRRAAVVGVR
jgi:hypothetical protein